MDVEHNKPKKTYDTLAYVVALIIASAFGTTILVKNWYFGIAFFLILGFLTIIMKKGFLKNRIFHS